MPLAWARHAGVTAFRPLLAELGRGAWQAFYEVSNNPTLRQPFYPLPSQVKGAISKAHLATALGVADVKELLRRCERPTPTRKAAECLFFTLGGAQVGRAAISGWRELLQPSLDRLRLWPFDGPLPSLLAQPGFVVAEIYPAEAYGHLRVMIGSRSRTTETVLRRLRRAARHASRRARAAPTGGAGRPGGQGGGGVDSGAGGVGGCVILVRAAAGLDGTFQVA